MSEIKIKNRKVYVFLCWVPVILFLIGIGLIIGGFQYKIQEMWICGLAMTVGMVFTSLVMFTKWWISKHKK